MPQRIQLRRSKGWKKPEGAVVCARPGILGNPFAHGDPAVAVQAFEHWLDSRPFYVEGVTIKADASAARRQACLAAIRDLRGADCCCWCALTAPCHVDVILRRANGRG